MLSRITRVGVEGWLFRTTPSRNLSLRQEVPMWAGQQYCRWQSLTSFGKTLWLPVAIVTWAAAVAIGWRLILDYEFKPESPNLAVATSWWPADTSLMIAPNRPTLLFFVHPKCPCTRASLAELERLWVLREQQAISSPHLIVVATVPKCPRTGSLRARLSEQQTAGRNAGD